MSQYIFTRFCYIENKEQSANSLQGTFATLKKIYSKRQTDRQRIPPFLPYIKTIAKLPCVLLLYSKTVTTKTIGTMEKLQNEKSRVSCEEIYSTAFTDT